MAVSSIRPALTENDIHRLIRGETAEERASVAHRLCRRIAIDPLSQEERVYADEIIQVLASDMAELVRRTLAVTLRNSPRLPREIALKLAQDVESVALPLLTHSPTFTDDDLIELALAATAAKQAAIAARSCISEQLTEVLAEHGDLEAVRTLAANPGAEWTDKAYTDGIDRFGSDESCQKAFISRDQIPIHIAEKLVTHVSGQLFDILINRHELPAQLAIDLASGARERATIDLVEQAGRATDHARFAQQLNLNGRLSHSLIIRALCMGHITFVEHAMAELSGVAHNRVWLLIHDAGPRGLQAVFDRAGLPRRFLPVFKTAITIFHETQLDGDTGDRRRFRARMIERVLSQYQALPKDDVDYLLDKLDAYAKEDRDAAQQIDAA